MITNWWSNLQYSQFYIYFSTFNNTVLTNVASVDITNPTPANILFNKTIKIKGLGFTPGSIIPAAGSAFALPQWWSCLWTLYSGGNPIPVPFADYGAYTYLDNDQPFILFGDGFLVDELLFGEYKALVDSYWDGAVHSFFAAAGNVNVLYQDPELVQ